MSKCPICGGDYEKPLDAMMLSHDHMAALVLKHERQIKDLAAHLLELKQLDRNAEQPVALRKDAARYRWLRDDKRGRSLSVSSLEWTGSAELSDAAVDAAKECGK